MVGDVTRPKFTLYESRRCPSCDRDFLFPQYGCRVCHDCAWTYDARRVRSYREAHSRPLEASQSDQRDDDGVRCPYCRRWLTTREWATQGACDDCSPR